MSKSVVWQLVESTAIAAVDECATAQSAAAPHNKHLLSM
jgi:hypothetical protein